MWTKTEDNRLWYTPGAKDADQAALDPDETELQLTEEMLVDPNAFQTSGAPSPTITQATPALTKNRLREFKIVTTPYGGLGLIEDNALIAAVTGGSEVGKLLDRILAET